MEELKPGTEIDGRYRLRARLASTRFSSVYRAEQLSTGQPVAIKVLELGRIPASGRASFERRFRREMAIYSEVRHPNLVRLLDTGHTDPGLYLVLEFLEGRTLNRLLREEGQLDPFECKHLMLQCLDALSAGHARGIVHRDFKPDNVMITSTGTARHAVVLDFGLAALREDTFAGDSGFGRRPITMPGTVPGTPAYMAPEQIRGAATAQSDIYAWALVYIECLTGRRAVPDGDTDMQTLARHLKEALVLPDWLERHPLGAILRRASAKDTEQRHATAREVLDELRTCPMGQLADERAVLTIEAPDEDDDDDDDEAPMSLIFFGDEPAAAESTSVATPSAEIDDPGVVTLPSLLVSELPDSEPPPVPAPIEGPAIDRAALEALFDDYLRICAALRRTPALERQAFIRRAGLEAEALRQAHGGGGIRYRIVIDGHEIKLQPAHLR